MFDRSDFKYPLQCFFAKTPSRGFWQFCPTGTYAGIGTTCVEFEGVMKSTKKKKYSLVNLIPDFH